jgi:hypothetical protein
MKDIAVGDKVRIVVTGEYGVVENATLGSVVVRTRDGNSYLDDSMVEKLDVIEALVDVLGDG